MSLRPHALEPVPEATARVAHAAFPTGHPYLTFRDALGSILQDEDCTALLPAWGQPALSPWRLALVTIMPFREHRADRQAAEAVRARIDWQYLLSLELSDPGFAFSVLSAFRDRLLAGSAAELLLDTLRERCRALGWLQARGPQRTDSTHVLAAIRVLNRLARVAETLRAALNAVAPVAPDWLQAVTPLAGYERSSRRIEASRLPKDKAEREAYAHTVGEDGCMLLDAVETPEAPRGLREFPRMEALRRTWQRHYERTPCAPASPGAPSACPGRCKASRDLPPAAEGLASPYEVEARSRHKRDTQWTGDMVHVSDTCDPTAPHLLTHVHTTPATVHEAQGPIPIQQALLAKEVPPRAPLVDAAYTSAELLVDSRDDHGITLRGPMRPSQGWQRQVAGADTIAQCTVDWERQQVSCPQGKWAARWHERVEQDGPPSIIASFRRQDGPACPARPLGTQAQQQGRRLRLPPQDQYEALTAARAWYASEEGSQYSKQRAGIEGTLSQGGRAFGWRRSRSWGLAKTSTSDYPTQAYSTSHRYGRGD
jgi:transposase